MGNVYAITLMVSVSNDIVGNVNLTLRAFFGFSFDLLLGALPKTKQSWYSFSLYFNCSLRSHAQINSPLAVRLQVASCHLIESIRGHLDFWSSIPQVETGTHSALEQPQLYAANSLPFGT